MVLLVRGRIALLRVRVVFAAVRPPAALSYGIENPVDDARCEFPKSDGRI